VILTQRDLLLAWKRGGISFTPDIGPEQIGLSSIDLRLGWVFSRLKENPGVVIQPARGFDPTNLVETDDFSQGQRLGQQPPFRLGPGEFRLALTLEEVTVPHNLVANVQGRSSLARSGLAVHITAPHINPGWSGPIALELYNHGPWVLELVPGEDLVCQVIYYRATKPVEKKVAGALGSYVGQRTPFPVRKVGSQTARSRSRTKR
jgi:dCTP deaminase